MVRRGRRIVAAFLFLVALGLGWGEAVAWAQEGAPRPSYEIRIRKYRFEPNRLVIPRGQTVTLRFTSLDVPHAVTLKPFGMGKQIVEKGRPVEVEVTATQPGVYKLRCTKFCGLGHLFFRRLTIEVQ